MRQLSHQFAACHQFYGWQRICYELMIYIALIVQQPPPTRQTHEQAIARVSVKVVWVFALLANRVEKPVIVLSSSSEQLAMRSACAC